MRTSDKLRLLKQKNVYFIDSWYSNNVLENLDKSAAGILNYPVFKNLSKCVIDIAKIKENKGVVKDKTRLVLASRARIFGTDGIRGVVEISPDENGRNFIQRFSQNSKFTPELLETTVYSFCELLLLNGTLKKEDKVLAGDDGRDYFKGKPFLSAVLSGIRKAGLTAVYGGVVPTPAIPLYMAKAGIKAGVDLTASHNPSNQNGVKFFVNGLKVLPEGPYGDYAITAFLYKNMKQSLFETGKYLDENSEVKNFFKASIVNNIPYKKELKNFKILFDPANGAGVFHGKEVFKKLGLKVTSVNDKPIGLNINQGGGVALLEGVEYYKYDRGSNTKSYPAVINKMIKEKHIFGLVLDGDADRVYLLVKNIAREAVYVIGGDKISYFLAKYIMRTKRPAKPVFINTVESDVMTNTAVEKAAGIKTRIVCVGDKWVVQGLKKGETLIVGAEESGHSIVPVKAAGKIVYTGNGIFVGLLCLSYLIKNNVSIDEICRPFEEGVKKTYYTYLIDKKLFQRGSKVFSNDRKIIKAEFKKLAKKYCLNGKIKEKIYKDEPDMLNMSVTQNGVIIGMIFARNSGTETKTSINIRCKATHKEIFSGIAAKIAAFHSKVLKDPRNPDTSKEKYILSVINKVKSFKELKLKTKMEEVQLKALLYGMSKEYFSLKEKILSIM
ncbi:MAG: hypothetical protein A2231_00475 [Candidatus Firestonebacteria bacterium RIFOXYA2_FULL_40_8]|nr:MAG: hypothetical protein A2231_00475 [Candidatus Firestonebacteria bacterium RIFOXYA2_FULL_40_8]